MKGGARPGAGRKPKADEQELIDKLRPMDAIAIAALQEGVKNKDYQFLKLFMDYRFGKPKEKVEHSGDLGIVWNEVRSYDTDEKTDESD
jgi:hypothetical protein